VTSQAGSAMDYPSFGTTPVFVDDCWRVAFAVGGT
jgi:hypothetical protein